ncbi:MAG: hypothetical protein HYZ94_01930 [Candidatus Omnitrophica bacterium]|nr:hypothetical protein [Candidatus Omnitrophota bacterium]
MTPPAGSGQFGVSYYGNRIPWRVKEDLAAIKQAGCTYVVHTFSEEDLEFYQPAMEEIVAESHRQGLGVWMDPWGVGQAFGGETYSSLVMKDLSLRQLSSRGEMLPIICPNQPGFRDYLLKWIEVCARYKPEYLFWDEPHFHIYPEQQGDAEPKLWACRCTSCEALFKKRHGRPMPETLTAEVRVFKEDSIVEFTRFLCDATVAAGMKAGICMLPFENSSTVNDWEKMAAIPSATIIGTDPYWRPRQPDVARHVGKAAERIAGLARKFNKEGQIWILNFNIPKGEESKIREAVEAAWGAGIRNLAAWSYFGASYIKLRAEDPPAVWAALSACYKDLSAR